MSILDTSTPPSRKHKRILLLCAFVVIPVLLMLLAIGQIPHIPHHASAVAAIKNIVTQENTYAETFPNHGYTCSLADLGGKPGDGPPTAKSAQLIGDDLASGHKAGHTFTLSHCITDKTKNIDEVIGYTLAAVPDNHKDRGYCTDESGVIRFDPKGGTNCTELLTQ